MPLVFKVEPGASVKLKDYDPGHDGGLKKSQGEQRLKDLTAELGELQTLLAAASMHSVLIVLQGMDTSGKDGTIRTVLSDVNAQGCRIEAFKVPTLEEQAHDFLWRIHQKTPGRGMMTVFNRSHYEDVLVARVHELAPEERIAQRYDQINHFERLLVQNDTIVIKFFLHISKDEQEERLLAREQDVTKAWKLSVGDWKERVYWDDYQRAYAAALSRCSTRYAPWHIVPSNRKWFRNLAVADTIVSQLRPYKKQWLAKLQRQSEMAVADIRAMRRKSKDEKTDEKQPSEDEAATDTPSAETNVQPSAEQEAQPHVTETPPSEEEAALPPEPDLPFAQPEEAVPLPLETETLPTPIETVDATLPPVPDDAPMLQLTEDTTTDQPPTPAEAAPAANEQTHPAD